MPPPNRPETSAFSLRRVGWTLCLLACVLVIGVQTWTWRQHRAWWAWFQDARTGYILWSTVAQREAMDVVGDVDGLTRAEVRQRLEAAFGPDRPFPTPPTPPGAMVAMPWMPEPPREYPVEWRVRERDWWITVTIFDGRADGLFVDTMRRVRAERRPPRSSGELWWLVIGGCTVVGGLGLAPRASCGSCGATTGRRFTRA